MIDAVPKGPARFIHAEILDLVAFLLQAVTDFNDIGF